METTADKVCVLDRYGNVRDWVDPCCKGAESWAQTRVENLNQFERAYAPHRVRMPEKE